MRTLSSFLLVTLIASSACATPAHAATLPVHTTALVTFHRDLAPYGTWWETPAYGWVFTPDVGPGWRPYADGHWASTDAGMVFVSAEPFAWATYHYGRWFWSNDYGWSWVPGTDWAPAWVAWRHGPAAIGWAPLAPTASFSTGVGFATGFDAGITSSSWAFVEPGALMSPTLADVVEPAPRNITIINSTTNVTSYRVVDNHVVNESIRHDEVERAVRHSVERTRVVETARGNPVERGQLAIYRPFDGAGAGSDLIGSRERLTAAAVRAGEHAHTEAMASASAFEEHAVHRAVSGAGDVSSWHERERAVLDRELAREHRVVKHQQRRNATHVARS